MAGHGVEQHGGVFAGEDHLAVGGMEEAVGDGAIAEPEKRIEVAIDVEQRDGLVMKAELRPSKSFKEFVERAETAGQGEEGLGDFVHERLAVVHGFDDMEAAESGVGDLFVNERLRDDANDVPAGGKSGVGEGAHQTDAGAAVDEAQAAAGDFRAGEARRVHVDAAGARTGSAEDTN